MEVRGKPSRMKEAVGELERDSSGEDEEGGGEWAEAESEAGCREPDEDGEGEGDGEEPFSQPFVFSSLRIRDRMAASGTRLPEVMIFSTSRPRCR